jgi:hypothetical protein
MEDDLLFLWLALLLIGWHLIAPLSRCQRLAYLDHRSEVSWGKLNPEEADPIRDLIDPLWISEYADLTFATTCSG